MKINCVSCGFKIELDRSYDDYEGAVRCPTCKTLLVIRTEQGFIKKVLFSSGKQAETAIVTMSVKPDSVEGSITQKLELKQDPSASEIVKTAESATYFHEATPNGQ